jgi:hypothetical protein
MWPINLDGLDNMRMLGDDRVRTQFGELMGKSELLGVWIKLPFCTPVEDQDDQVAARCTCGLELRLNPRGIRILLEIKGCNIDDPRLTRG